ncbi:DUF1611 domain-containing protein [Larkinella humicola]|uniref:DUF1611 domain-containing protein n=1 Tax=Larkinella humicola TaxID=2607654 RepID=A0A5N1JB88_9BACT|nr:DUF1611 domain-containing protein [Larkinella humicola]KAA9346666.1 DUF1611 domain-containing protein [Larkinella humicola]
MNDRALLLTNGLLASPDAKTAHGLIRDSERYTIAGVIDPPTAGRDAGEVLDGKPRQIPVFASLEEALAAVGPVQCGIVGVATVGGVLPEEILTLIKTCLQNGLSVVNGLHDLLNDRPELVALAAEYRANLIDIRKPKSRAELHFWSGDVFKITAPIIAVLGMDCAMGKRTTTRLLTQACQAAGLHAQMIYTGQTGWLQGGKYGFIFDSTLNDFISGEIEHALVSCWQETGADVLVIEGQSSLRNPSGPCGLEFMVSGNAKHVVLMHAPKRTYFDYDEHWGKIPSVESEIEIIQKFGSEVIALALNTENCTLEETKQFQQEYTERLGIPVLLPLQEGLAPVVPIIRQLVEKTVHHAD